MAEKDTKNWDVYDWLDIAEYNNWKRRCPMCGETDVKYAVHEKSIIGCELSVRCNDCKHCDRGDNRGDDAERLVREWHEQPNDLKSGEPPT